MSESNGYSRQQIPASDWFTRGREEEIKRLLAPYRPPPTFAFDFGPARGPVIRNLTDPASLEPEPERERTFGVDPLIGWRVWKVSAYRRLDGTVEPRLAQIAGPALWQPRERATAVCSRQQVHSAHEAPDPDCKCGFWAISDRAEAERLAQRNRPAVFGTVAMWGRVLEFERGFRAQHAYPQMLYGYAGADEPAVRQLGDLYDVDVRVVLAPVPDKDEMLGSVADISRAADRIAAAMAKGMVSMNFAMNAAMQQALGHQRRLAMRIAAGMPVLVAHAIDGRHVMDVYSRASHAAHEADRIHDELRAGGVDYRRRSRFRFEFPSGGIYDLVAGDGYSLLRHFEGRRPDIVDMHSDVPPELRGYLRARGVTVL